MPVSSRAEPDGDVVAIVVALLRYPLKSAAGERLERADLEAGGLAGDRAWLVEGPDGRPLRARDVAALALLTPDDVHLRADALEDRLGVTGAHVVAADTRQAPRAAVHVVGRGAEADPQAPPGADPGRRANLVLASTDDVELAPGAERGWVGAVLAIGTAELRVSRLPGRCLGVYADVSVPGTIAVGDLVRRRR